MVSLPVRRGPNPQKIFDALKKHSPESTLSVAHLTPPGADEIPEVHPQFEPPERPKGPPQYVHSLPPIGICCGCMCSRLRLICECQGLGCTAGFWAWFEMKNGRCITKIEPPRNVPLPINRKKTFKNSPEGFTKYMAPLPHNINDQLEKQVRSGLRDLVRAHNEAVACWLSGGASGGPWGSFPWENYFVDLEPQVQPILESVKGVIAASMNQYQTALLIPFKEDEDEDED